MSKEERNRKKVEYNRKWREENRDRLNATRRARRAEDYEHRKAVEAKWRERNREKVREQNRIACAKYRKNNKAKRMELKARRRAAQKYQIPAWFDEDEVKYIYNLASERGLEVDHIVPLISDTVCGLHVQDNMRCISSELNKYKGNRYWSDMP